MRYIRINNDVKIKWEILRNTDPEVFTSKDITVKLFSKCGCEQPISYTIVDNIIFIDYFGKDQKETGAYRLCLIENDGKPNMATLDYVDCFTLSKTLKNQTSSGSDSSSSLETEVIELSSKLNTTGVEYIGGDGIDVIGSVISVDDTVARTEDLNALEVKLDTKADASELADYATKANFDKLVDVYTKGAHAQNEFNGTVSAGLLDLNKNKADKSEIPTVPTNVSAFTNDAGYLTEHQDISNLATKTELNSKADKSSLSNYATRTDLNNKQDKLSNYQENNAGALIQVDNRYIDVNNYENGGINLRVGDKCAMYLNNSDGSISLNGTVVKTNGKEISTKDDLNSKQDILVSGTNIKTINGESILGSGNIHIEGGEGGGVTPEQLNEEISNRENADTNLQNQINNKQDQLISGNNLATINGYNLLDGGNIEIQGGGIEEAPQDGYQYARQNGGWSIVQGGSGGGDVYAAGDNTFTGINIFNNNLSAIGVFTVTDPRDGYQDSLFNILVSGHNYSSPTYYTISEVYAEGQKIAWDDEQGRYTAVNDGNYNIKHIYVYNNFNYVYQITNDFEAFWWNGNEYTEEGNPILKKIEYNVTPWYEYVVEVFINVPVDFAEDVNLFYYFDSYQQSYLESNLFIKEAPTDGQQYVRQNSSWQTIQIPEAGVPEAPTDGNKYARQNGEWVSLGGDDYITVPIASYDDLVNAMNEYNSNADGLSKRYYYLENDIDCGEQYLPGFGTNTNAGIYFGNKCVFDGRLHKISNFKIQGSDNTGFFNNVSDAEIMNLYLENFEISGGAFVGFIGVQRNGAARIHDISMLNGTVTAANQNAAAISGLFMDGGSSLKNIYVENVQVSGALESSIITGWKNEGTSIIQNIAIYNSTVSGSEYGRPLWRGNGTANYIYWNNPQGDTDYSGHSDINDTDIVDGTLVNNLNSNLSIGDWVQGSQRPEFNPLILKDLPVSTEVTTDRENRFIENNYFAKDIYEGGTKLSDKYALKSEITPTTPNVVKFGDISIENGIMSNFSADNYAQFPFLVDLTDKAFEITMEITTGGDVSTQQNILDSRDGLAFAIRNGQFVLAVSNNGTSWAFEANGGTVEANTTYLVKLSWNKEMYSVKYSTNNGASWTIAINTEYLYSPYPRQILIGKDTTGNYVFGGQINLNKCTLSINGQYVWDGMADAGLLTRLDTSLSNIDADGVDKIKEIVSSDDFATKDELNSKVDKTDFIYLTATLADGQTKVTYKLYGVETY